MNDLLQKFILYYHTKGYISVEILKFFAKIPLYERADIYRWMAINLKDNEVIDCVHMLTNFYKFAQLSSSNKVHEFLLNCNLVERMYFVEQRPEYISRFFEKPFYLDLFSVLNKSNSDFLKFLRKYSDILLPKILFHKEANVRQLAKRLLDSE